MTQALAQPDPDLQPEILIALGQSQLDQGDQQQAFEYFHAAARSGHSVALNMLGRAYERGWGCARNATKAAQYFQAAAQQGDAWAKFNLADLMFKGDGTPLDQAGAFLLYAEAAKAGVAKALNMLGLACEEGSGTQKSMEQAIIYYRAGAQSNDCWAAFNMARLALQMDQTMAALPWLEMALQNGFADFYHAMAEALQLHPDPTIQAMAKRALDLATGRVSP